MFAEVFLCQKKTTKKSGKGCARGDCVDMVVFSQIDLKKLDIWQFSNVPAV